MANPFFYDHVKKAMGEPTVDALLVGNKLKKKPCSKFLKITVECPLCGRQMQAKTLHYKHKCFAQKQGKIRVSSAEEEAIRWARAE